MEVKINGDSSRRGCGKVKHLEVKQFWLQEQVRSGKVDFHEVSRINNPSDALNHCIKEEAKNHFKHVSLEWMVTSSGAGRGEGA